MAFTLFFSGTQANATLHQAWDNLDAHVIDLTFERAAAFSKRVTDLGAVNARPETGTLRQILMRDLDLPSVTRLHPDANIGPCSSTDSDNGVETTGADDSVPPAARVGGGGGGACDGGGGACDGGGARAVLARIIHIYRIISSTSRNQR